MEITFNSPLVILPMLMPVLAGMMASFYGRNFWVWLLISIPLPFIANLLILALPDLSEKEQPRPVENDELFDHLFLSAFVQKQQNRLAAINN